MIIFRKGYFMPKMVLCCKEGQEDKFYDTKQIPLGWVIDRLVPAPVVGEPGPTFKNEGVGGSPEFPPPLREKFLRAKEYGKTELPETTDGLDITSQPDSFKEGSTIGEEKTTARRKPGPKPKAKPEG